MVIITDANIFIDLQKIGLLGEYFKLEREIYTTEGIFRDELLSPGLREELISLGIQITNLTSRELFLAVETRSKHRKLSSHDCEAYAIAKSRNWMLTTGDRRLRLCAEESGVEVHGLLWIMRQCLDVGSLDLVHSALKTIQADDTIRIGQELLKREFSDYFE